MTDLIRAVKKGHVEKVEKILHADSTKASFCNAKGLTPLLVAAEEGDLECVKLLLANDADVNKANSRTSQTPILVAATLGFDEIVWELFRKNARCDYHGDDGLTVIHWAVKRRMHQFLRRLSSRPGMDLNIKTLTEGATPLHLCLEDFDPELMEILVKEARVDVNCTDSVGQTPLHVGVALCNYEGVQFLLEHGANPNVQDDNGSTPLHLCYDASLGATTTEAARLRVAELLRSHGADEAVQNSSGKTADQVADDVEAEQEAEREREQKERMHREAIKMQKQSEKKAERMAVSDEVAQFLFDNDLTELSDEFGMRNIELKDIPSITRARAKKITENHPELRERLREAIELFSAQVAVAEQAMLELQPETEEWLVKHKLLDECKGVFAKRNIEFQSIPHLSRTMIFNSFPEDVAKRLYDAVLKQAHNVKRDRAQVEQMIQRGDLEIHDDPHGDGFVAVVHAPEGPRRRRGVALPDPGGADGNANGEAEAAQPAARGGRGARARRAAAARNAAVARVGADRENAEDLAARSGRWSWSARIGILAVIVYALVMLLAGVGVQRLFSN